MLVTITREMLLEFGACKEAYAQFRDTFPDGLTIETNSREFLNLLEAHAFMRSHLGWIQYKLHLPWLVSYQRIGDMRYLNVEWGHWRAVSIEGSLKGATLVNMSVEYSTFHEVGLPDYFQGRIESSYIKHCRSSRIMLANSYLANTHFYDCTLGGYNIEDSFLKNCTFECCTFEFPFHFRSCTLQDCTFPQTNLHEGIFKECHFVKTIQEVVNHA